MAEAPTLLTRDGATISQYNIDPVEKGALSPKDFPATVRPAYRGKLLLFGLAVSPNGKNVYAAVGNGIWQYDVDPVSGTLSSMTPASVPAGTVPVSVAVTADGKSAFATNAISNDVSQYDISPRPVAPCHQRRRPVSPPVSIPLASPSHQSTRLRSLRTFNRPSSGSGPVMCSPQRWRSRGSSLLTTTSQRRASP